MEEGTLLFSMSNKGRICNSQNDSFILWFFLLSFLSCWQNNPLKCICLLSCENRTSTFLRLRGDRRDGGILIEIMNNKLSNIVRTFNPPLNILFTIPWYFSWIVFPAKDFSHFSRRLLDILCCRLLKGCSFFSFFSQFSHRFLFLLYEI